MSSGASAGSSHKWWLFGSAPNDPANTPKEDKIAVVVDEPRSPDRQQPAAMRDYMESYGQSLGLLSGPGGVQASIQASTQATVRNIVESHVKELDAKLDTQAAAMEEVKGWLKAGPRQQHDKGALEGVTESMRRDLAIQRELLARISQQLPSLKEEVISLRSDVESLRRDGPSRVQAQEESKEARPKAHQESKAGALIQEKVETKKQAQEVAAMREQLASMRRDIEYASIKAGFLAVAASECGHEEKTQLFEKLKAREEAIKAENKEAEEADAVGSTGFVAELKEGMRAMRQQIELVSVRAGFLAIASSECGKEEKDRLFTKLQQKEEALKAMLESNALQISPDGWEYTIDVDRSGGEQLGLTVDSSDGETLRVEVVRDGLLKRWNDNNEITASRIRADDRIVEVNNAGKGNSRELSELLAGRMPLTIKLRRAM